eukprot:GEMP01085666.1.p1 GENE.GEMP01085666.1~~GEMP01085666.1.p1  ORF type:complete len:268 (+),score=47.12 GEMP01085666.1:66-869(+)
MAVVFANQGVLCLVGEKAVHADELWKGKVSASELDRNLLTLLQYLNPTQSSARQLFVPRDDVLPLPKSVATLTSTCGLVLGILRRGRTCFSGDQKNGGTGDVLGASASILRIVEAAFEMCRRFPTRTSSKGMAVMTDTAHQLGLVAESAEQKQLRADMHGFLEFLVAQVVAIPDGECLLVPCALNDDHGFFMVLRRQGDWFSLTVIDTSPNGRKYFPATVNADGEVASLRCVCRVVFMITEWEEISPGDCQRGWRGYRGSLVYAGYS